MNIIRRLGLLAMIVTLGACATHSEPYDYGAFKESDPRSILVLMPTNESPEAQAEYGVWAQTHRPQAESGYYVFPAALVNATFRSNGMTQGDDIQKIPLNKLRDIFGADAVLYLNIEQYGTSYRLIESVTKVKISGRLLDARTGRELWRGTANASNQENQQNQNQGILGALISAAINQIADTVGDRSYDVAGIADYRLLGAGGNRDMLYGPRSPHYWKNPQPVQP
ncbi:MAG: DUF799 domain-containing protein [Neisseria sp.]|nr:DUF799 domain-containing protein [Neisseria sp.]